MGCFTIWQTMLLSCINNKTEFKTFVPWVTEVIDLNFIPAKAVKKNVEKRSVGKTQRKNPIFVLS